MGYQVMEKDKIIKAYEDFVNNGTVKEDYLDSNHKAIRQFFLDNYQPIKQSIDESGESKAKKMYLLDLELALRFYEFMNSQADFDDLYASNYMFWRTIAVFDIPDIVADRWGTEAKDHFYAKNTRVYPYVLYWYIKLCWQGDKEKTKAVLLKNDEDVVLQLVERTNKIGTNLDFYRTFMKDYQDSCYDETKKEILLLASKEHKTMTLFRIAMVKNTSKLVVFRPEFYPGGIEGYIRMILDVKGELV